MIVDKEDVPEGFDKVAIDSDIIRYRAAFAAQKTFWHLYDLKGIHVERFDSAKSADDYLSDLEEFMLIDVSGYYREPEIVVSDAEAARNACDLIISQIHKEVPAKEYVYYLTDPKENYREEISKTLVYKGSRTQEKPVHHDVVKEHLVSKYGAKIAKNAEADDACCVVGARGYRSKTVNTCVVSCDKDLMGSPGYLYNFVKGEWYYQTELEADRFFWQQTLQGDKQVDNILGLANVSEEFRKKYGLRKSKGLGTKAAEKILKDCETNQEMFEVVKEAYQSYHGDNWKVVLNEMGKLLWMQRKKGVVFDVSWYEEGG